METGDRIVRQEMNQPNPYPYTDQQVQYYMQQQSNPYNQPQPQYYPQQQQQPTYQHLQSPELSPSATATATTPTSTPAPSSGKSINMKDNPEPGRAECESGCAEYEPGNFSKLPNLPPEQSLHNSKKTSDIQWNSCVIISLTVGCCFMWILFHCDHCKDTEYECSNCHGIRYYRYGQCCP